MTGSASRTASFTITDARHVGAKIGADLRLLHNLYGKPALANIDGYVEEAALLLRGGYLNTVDFGFKQPYDNAWRLRLRYTATVGGHLVDSRPGSLPAAIQIAGIGFYSYLTYSAKFQQLTDPQQASVKDTLPVKRTGAAEPTALSGTHTGGHGYARNGAGVGRDVYTAF